MGPLALQRFDAWTRGAIPLLLTVVIAILNIVPLRLPDYAVVAPGFVLMAVYYWTVHRPDLMRPWGVFAVGLIEDILSGAPLGVNALVLLFAHWAIVSQHKVFRGQSFSFALLWCGFALVASGAKILMMVIALALGYGLGDPSRLLTQYALTVALYPVIALVMGRAQRVLLPAA